MSRLVICQKEGSTEMNAPPTNCKDVRPVSSVPCNTHPCNHDAAWNFGAWSQVLHYCSNSGICAFTAMFLLFLSVFLFCFLCYYLYRNVLIEENIYVNQRACQQHNNYACINYLCIQYFIYSYWGSTYSFTRNGYWLLMLMQYVFSINF